MVSPTLEQGEHRAEARCTMDLGAHVVPLRAGAAAAAMAVRVHDVSIKGIGLQATQALRVAEQFILRVPITGGPPVWIQCIVRRWQPLAADRFFIGAEYVRIVAVAPAGQSPADEPDPVEASQTLKQAAAS